MEDEDDEGKYSCKKKKCRRILNPCKICLQPCKQKNAMQCAGACGSWVHYRCAGLTKGKILDIKSGTIQITCPCPDCKSSLPKELRVGDDAVFSCNNVKCPANNPPSCDSDTCQANLASDRFPKRCPPPGTLRKCGKNVCRVFSDGIRTYSYSDDCSNKCTYKDSDDSCYDHVPKNYRKTYHHRDNRDNVSDSGSLYSCTGDSPSDVCCDIDLPENRGRRRRPQYILDGDTTCGWEDKRRCRKRINCQSDEEDRGGSNISVVACRKQNSSKCKKKKKKKPKMKEQVCCCGHHQQEEEEEDDYGYYPNQERQAYDQQGMAEEMMALCKTVVDIERRIESMLGKIVCRQQEPIRTNRNWQVHMASVNRGMSGFTDFKYRKPHHHLHVEKRDLYSLHRKKYEKSFKKMFIVISAIFARMHHNMANKNKTKRKFYESMPL